MRAEWDKTTEAPVTRVCKKCGEKFVPAPYHQFITYKGQGNTTRKGYYCKWSCYNHRDEPTTRKQGAQARPVLMYSKDGQFIGEFESAQQAALKLTEMGKVANNRAIQRACRGELPHYRGYIFKYKE